MAMTYAQQQTLNRSVPATTAGLKEHGVTITVISFACELCNAIHTQDVGFKIDRYECGAIGRECENRDEA